MVIEARLVALSREIEGARQLDVNEEAIRSALEAFGPVWESLWPAERSRILRLLIERIDYEGRDGGIAVRLRQDGIGSPSDAQPA